MRRTTSGLSLRKSESSLRFTTANTYASMAWSRSGTSMVYTSRGEAHGAAERLRDAHDHVWVGGDVEEAEEERDGVVAAHELRYQRCARWSG